jgi:hypothetical protein
MPPVACGILLGKREPARTRALEGGRDVLKRVCVRVIRPQVRSVLAGTIRVARRLRVGRAEGRCLGASLFVEKPSTGVSFARPDCREIVRTRQVRPIGCNLTYGQMPAPLIGVSV